MSVGKLGLNSLPPDFFIFHWLLPCLYSYFFVSRRSLFSVPQSPSLPVPLAAIVTTTQPFIGQIIGNLGKDNGIGSEYTILQ